MLTALVLTGQFTMILKPVQDEIGSAELRHFLNRSARFIQTLAALPASGGLPIAVS